MAEQLQFDSSVIPLGRVDAAAGQINVKMLTLAREAKGFSQKELASRINCNQSRLSKIESGELLAQEMEIQGFIKELDLSRDFFFQRDDTIPASVSFYRKTRTFPLKVLRQCNAQMNVRRLQIERQIGAKKLGKRDLPYMPPERYGGAKAVAKKLRQEWSLKPGAVQHLVKLIEDAGCVVVDYSFPSLKLDGLSIRAPKKTPIIFLNKDLPKSRQRYSLAHELGHLVMHTNPHERVEEEAWDFAGEFMMPAAQIQKQLNNLNLDKLGQLKNEWGLSMQAILHRAKKLGEISESGYRFLCIQIGKYGFRVNEPFEDAIPIEKPTELEKRLM